MYDREFKNYIKKWYEEYPAITLRASKLNYVFNRFGGLISCLSSPIILLFVFIRFNDFATTFIGYIAILVIWTLSVCALMVLYSYYRGTFAKRLLDANDCDIGFKKEIETAQSLFLLFKIAQSNNLVNEYFKKQFMRFLRNNIGDNTEKMESFIEYTKKCLKRVIFDKIKDFSINGVITVCLYSILLDFSRTLYESGPILSEYAKNNIALLIFTGVFLFISKMYSETMAMGKEHLLELITMTEMLIDSAKKKELCKKEVLSINKHLLRKNRRKRTLIGGFYEK